MPWVLKILRKNSLRIDLKNLAESAIAAEVKSGTGIKMTIDVTVTIATRGIETTRTKKAIDTADAIAIAMRMIAMVN